MPDERNEQGLEAFLRVPRKKNCNGVKTHFTCLSSSNKKLKNERDIHGSRTEKSPL